jgi:hypothetical protein
MVELRRRITLAKQARSLNDGDGRYHHPAGRRQAIDQTGFARAGFLDLAETDQAAYDEVLLDGLSLRVTWV